MNIIKKALRHYLLYLGKTYAVLLCLALLLIPIGMLQWHMQQCVFDCSSMEVQQYTVKFAVYFLTHPQVIGYWTYFPHLCAISLILYRWFGRLLD